MVFNATFNNTSAISWRSILLVKETRVHGKNHRPVASHWQTLSHNVVSERGSNSVVIYIECICSCKYNYHTITATTAPREKYNTNKMEEHVSLKNHYII
jgi:hypothetical protein